MPKVRLPHALIVFLLAPAALGAHALRSAPPMPSVSAPPSKPSAENAAFFAKEVKPILQQNCFTCHSGDKPSGGLNLTSRAAILKGGLSGPAVSLTKPDESRLLKAVAYQGLQMPPSGRLPQSQIDFLTRWVKMGMPWDSGKAAAQETPRPSGPPPVTPETMKFWSFQPVRRPKLPTVKRKEWVRNPIDAFVLKRLEAAGLAPNPPASKAALLRRATYDLTGLPPSPAEVQAFLADKSPNAYEKRIDRLLASPRYGEKWGRHWLDLARYAETNSYERDGNKPNAWRYRDYVIQSLNQDKPYNQFVTEQLAGDELPERTPERLIATGYYRLGLWDDEPADPQQALYDDLDDIASTTAQVFLGLTINCARCHDHKLDPIPQKDYYRFLSFFNGLNRYGDHVQRPIAPEAEVQKQRAEIAAHEAKVKKNRDETITIEQRVASDLTPVEKEEFRNEAARAPILKKRVPSLLSQAEFDRYLALQEERKTLVRFQPTALDTALCVTEDGPNPRVTHVLMRGNPHVEGDVVEPGFPSVLNPPKPEITPPIYGDSCGRRLALARWIADKRNALTARVMVNRVWQYHFGRGIVRTPSNFGFQGIPPTHPELLDWLASNFVEGGNWVIGSSGNGEKRNWPAASSQLPNYPTTQLPDPFACGWSLKKLHRLIMLSSTYRMTSQANPRALAKDPENDLLWRFDMRRLEAEEVRDSILSANGSLNLEMGGPSIYPTMPAAVLASQSMPGAGWGKSTPEQQRRRSVYIYVKRSLISPLIASFDGPETDFTCPVRFATTQPTQALGLLNSDFINQQAHIFAAYLRKQAGEKPADQVKLGLQRVLQREPALKEIARGVNLIAALRKEPNVSAEDALTHFCVVALNLNEFLYLD